MSEADLRRTLSLFLRHPPFTTDNSRRRRCAARTASSLQDIPRAVDASFKYCIFAACGIDVSDTEFIMAASPTTDGNLATKNESATDSSGEWCEIIVQESH